MLKLKRFNEAVWFNWPEASGVRLKIRPLNGRKMLELRNESKQGKVAVSMPSLDPEEGNIRIVDDYNDFIYEWKMFQYCLEDYEGITLDGEDDHPKELEGEAKSLYEQKKREEIREAIFNNVLLRRFILKKSLEVMASENKRFEEELKNSLGSLDG